MKILLDHNLDWRMKRYFQAHYVTAAYQIGWERLKNGALLEQAEEKGFEVLLTGDANILYQQNLAGRGISVVALRSPDNRLKTHLTMLPEILVALDEIEPGQFRELFHPDMSR